MTTTQVTDAAADEPELGKLNAAGIEAFRGKIAVDWPYNRWTTWNEVATRDGIRHYANGFGDDNPLWSDPDYASGTRWGGIVAPPGFLEGAGLTPKITTPPEARSRGKGALSGVHMFWAGDHIRFFAPVREGDRIWVRRFYVDIQEKQRSRFGGRSAVSVRRRVYWNDSGELIAIWDADFVHTERAAAAKRNTEDKPLEQYHYSRAELEEIDRHYAMETVRGSEKRYVEDVAIGEEFTPRYRGPLVVGDVIAWLQGNGRHEIFPYRLNWKNRQRMGGFYAVNEFGAWDSAMRVHWDDGYARSVGARRAYDYGMLRNAWLMHAVTDWMGDDAIIVGVEDRVTGFNTLGDLTRISGRVAAIDDANGYPEVLCALECHSQRDERTAHGTVRVRLPSRNHGLPDYPAAPADHGLLPGMPKPEEGPWAR